MPRLVIAALVAATVAASLCVGILIAIVIPTVDGTPDPSRVAGAEPSAQPGAASPSPTAPASATPAPTATPTPRPTPVPTPVLVPAPLTGVPVSPAVAAQHPIAVMVDDHSAARPQSGFDAASVVWQAPAEGGIPRYMLMYQENLATSIGPVRSARYYYIAWAAEWRAVYAHSGGSPQALATLRSKGAGQLVYNADEFRWAHSFWRVKDRFGPHNLYTDGEHLRALSKTLKASDQPMEPVWTFARELEAARRPRGGQIDVAYKTSQIHYGYDWTTNTYPRSVTGEKKQTDAATGKRVAPKNVVIMLMRFAPLRDGTNKQRLEAQVVGKGAAWISTNGKTVKGTWRKDSLTAPTLFFDAAGKPAVLSAGQTFVQVMEIGTKVSIKPGAAPPRPAPLRIGRLES